MNDGKLEEFVRKDKTDMEAEGTTFTMVARGRYFQMELVIKEYLRGVKVTGTQILFPKNLGSSLKRMGVTYSVMYSALEEMKTRLDLEASLTWHSFRIGSATKDTKMGVSRNVLKKAGNWKSSAVDGYCCSDDAGVVLSRALADAREQWYDRF